MKRQIRDLKDKKSGVKFYPKTHIKAVVDNEDNTLASILTTLKNAIDNFEGGSEYDDTEIRGMINDVKTALDTLIGTGNVTEAIDSANEIFAFLDTFKNDKTLANVLASLMEDMEEWVEGKGYALASSIPTIPSSLPANGGNADTVDNYHFVVGSSAGTAANTIYFVV